MRSEPAIRVEGIGKSYPICRSSRDRVRQIVLAQRGRPYAHPFRALRNVSFSIERGESVGIIGRNGSGKSTLLEIIAGTLQPTEGSVSVRGRVAALLELGSGFNPDFTGRENVLLNASILGMRRADIEARFDAIAGFADIGEFVDQPVRTYSSGMLVRLAFSVQLHLDPDILVIDEALAVGDELFQRKCFAALADFHENGGTLLFVSHVGNLVKELCGRALLLDRGEMLLISDSNAAVEEYHRFVFSGADQQAGMREDLKNRYLQGSGRAPAAPAGLRADATAVEPAGADTDFHSPELSSPSFLVYPGGVAAISEPRLERLDGTPVNHLLPRQRYRFRYRVTFRHSAGAVSFSMLVKSKTGLPVGGMAASDADGKLLSVARGDVYDVCFEFDNVLLPGLFYVNCGVNGVSRDSQGFLGRIVDCVVFRVIEKGHARYAGHVDLNVAAKIQTALPAQGERQT